MVHSAHVIVLLVGACCLRKDIVRLHQKSTEHHLEKGGIFQVPTPRPSGHLGLGLLGATRAQTGVVELNAAERSARTQVVHERIRDMACNLFLEHQAPTAGIHQPRHSSESQDASAGYVRHKGFPLSHKQMMRTDGGHVQLVNQDGVMRHEDRFGTLDNELCQVDTVTTEQFIRVSVRHTSRRTCELGAL